MEHLQKDNKNHYVAYLLLGLFLFAFFFIDLFKLDSFIPSSYKSVHVMFLSIVLEALPFILLGVFVSSIIQIFVSEETVKRYLPKNPFVAILPAALLGAIFPVCECAIVPIVRRLIKKGVPVHLGVVFLVGGPILNPVVFASTYYAFQSNVEIAYARMGLAFVLSIVIGFIIYLLFENSPQLKNVDRHHHHHGSQNKWMSVLQHASDEFFDMGKYLIFGAFIASLFQAFLDRTILTSIGNNEWFAPLVMMIFAYVLSLCSEADAFVASSFSNLFTANSLLAFLVYGPMIDLKNTILLFAYFKKRFVFTFVFVVTLVVYCSVLLYPVIFG
ncbi:permease [Bacillus sp. FJAT-47783]|uniref:permease n=1 Tax=Bacillus sp. FJAT-47783 TaxID=2922712 RepID=UPI001FAC26D3|nr:permease [Bacillus sp. FJAT-47783]